MLQKAIQELTGVSVIGCHLQPSQARVWSRASNPFKTRTSNVHGRVAKIDNDHIIIKGNSKFVRLFCRYSEKDIDKVLELREDSRIEVSGLFVISWSLFEIFLTMNNCQAE